MKRIVYRSLDTPSSLFKMKGKFIFVFLVGLGLGIVVLILFSVIGWDIVGLVLALLIVGVSVGFTFLLQGRMTERQLSRLLASRKYPDYIRLSPDSFDLRKTNGVLEKKEKDLP